MAIKGICLVLTAILGIDVHFVSVYKNAKRYWPIPSHLDPTLGQKRILYFASFVQSFPRRGAAA